MRAAEDADEKVILNDHPVGNHQNLALISNDD
jgi:hypothetical protein